MRSCVISAFALAVVLAPAATFAQTTTTGQPPATTTGQPPAEQPAAPAAPKVGFTTPAGMLLVSIKPDKTADFEQIMKKVHEALLKAPDPQRRQQAAGWRVMSGPAPSWWKTVSSSRAAAG